MPPLSLYWAETREALIQLAKERGLEVDVHVDMDELVLLLQEDDDEFNHQYDKYSLKDLKVIAKSSGLKGVVNSKAGLIEFLTQPPSKISRLDDLKLLRKARDNKSRWDKRFRPKPTWIKEGCIKKRVQYSADDYISQKQCEGKVQGKKCNKWDEVSVEVMISKEKYICNDCMKNKTKK